MLSTSGAKVKYVMSCPSAGKLMTRSTSLLKIYTNNRYSESVIEPAAETVSGMTRVVSCRQLPQALDEADEACRAQRHKTLGGALADTLNPQTGVVTHAIDGQSTASIAGRAVHAHSTRTGTPFFESAKFLLGDRADRYADYFETCRRKRNTIDYTFSNVATETEAKEILAQAAEFYHQVEDWIAKNHPSLKKQKRCDSALAMCGYQFEIRRNQYNVQPGFL